MYLSGPNELFEDSIRFRNFKLCNHLLRCGIKINYTAIKQCTYHNDDIFLSQLWDYWENPCKNIMDNNFVELAQYFIDESDDCKNLKFIIEKIESMNEKVELSIGLINYIYDSTNHIHPSLKSMKNTKQEFLILLFSYIPAVDILGRQINDKM